MEGYIHSIETMGAVDGPGLRFVIFFQGCPMRCLYCHNPDSWDISKGKKYSTSELIKEVMKYKSYYGETGGITASGGEPTLQIDFLTELFKELKKLNIHTCLDSCGIMFNRDDKNILEKFNELMKWTDLILLDLKHIDDESHIKLTSKSNKNILDFFKYLDEIKKPIWLRYVLVPTINSDRETLIKTKKFIDTLSNVEKIEILPYHTLGVKKYEELNIEYKLKDVPTPNKEQIEMAENILIKGKEL